MDARTPAKQAEEYSALTFDIRLSTLDIRPTPALTVAGSVSCAIDIKSLIELSAAEPLKTAAKHAFGGRSTDQFTAPMEELAIKNMSNRWKMGQTIVSRRPTTTREQDDLTVTALLTGYPGLSLQIVLSYVDGVYRFKQTLPAAAWAQCR